MGKPEGGLLTQFDPLPGSFESVAGDFHTSLTTTLTGLALRLPFIPAGLGSPLLSNPRRCLSLDRLPMAFSA
jgi:hypothetical protein